jgi:hypothetical protein
VPLKNVTVPLGALGPGGVVGATVAVSITGDPNVALVGVTVSTDVEGSAVTTSEHDAELPAKPPVGV